MKLKTPLTQNRGFTLTEVLVSSALIVAIMALMLTTVDQTSRTINSTTGRVAQFQSARIAFDAMTRNLSQATLNTYWDLDRDVNKNPLRYRRQSDLHFVSGKTVRAATPNQPIKFFGKGESGGPETENYYPGHAVMFQAPLGYTASEVGTGKDVARNYGSLSNLLSVVGYYLKWDKDTSLPDFARVDKDLIADRYRYRLMEVLQPGETNMVYNNLNYTTITNLTGVGTSNFLLATDWVQAALGHINLPPQILTKYVPGRNSQAAKNKNRINYSRPLAENIVALILLPKRAEQDRDKDGAWDDLTKDFEYDSRPKIAYDTQARIVPNAQLDVVAALKAMDYRYPRQLHQLPPIMQVTMVAIDEESAVKLQDWVMNSNGGTPPDWSNGMFTKVTSPQAFLKELGDPSNPDAGSLVSKISNSDRKLPHPKMNYRVFTTDVVLRGAKWTKTE